MISCELKLKLTKKQEETLNSWFPILQSVYNFAIKKVELNAKNKIYFSKSKFNNLLANHSTKLGIPSHTLQGTLMQAYNAWERCFGGLAQKPKLKSHSHKLNTIIFPDLIKVTRNNNTIKIYPLEHIKFFKQTIPEGKIKNGIVLKRVSGWYIRLAIENKPSISKTRAKPTNQVGIDTGFKNLLTLSDGTKFEHPKEYQKLEKRLGQAQRGNNKHLTAKIQERIKNQKKDRNHKISRKIVENYQDIFVTKDNLSGQQRNKFGKSVNNANIHQLRNFILYKGLCVGRRVEFVESKFTTMTCSNCGSLTGPHGLRGLAVRSWECSACGAVHDRDVNSGMVVLKIGLGLSLGNPKCAKQNHNKFLIEPLFEIAYLNSKLPNSPNYVEISRLQQKLYLEHWKSKGLI